MTKSIVIDVDLVLCNAEDLSVEYYDRPAYPFAIEAVKALKAAGFFIRIQTARGMDRFDGDLPKIIAYHERSLKDWLSRNGIPYDEVLFGKGVTSTYYVDDRGFHLDSSQGRGGWDLLLDKLGVPSPFGVPDCTPPNTDREDS